jgi:hypothetical protein
VVSRLPQKPRTSVPGVAVSKDPAYADGSGSDRVLYRIPSTVIDGAARVRATLHYQTIPPYYLRDRFVTAQAPETKRLHFIASRLATAGTANRGLDR